MIFKTFSFWIWFVIFGVLALILASKPLFNILAFEFCAVITICVAFGCAYVAMSVFQSYKREFKNLTNNSKQFPLISFLHALKANIILLSLPLIIILFNAFRVKNCNFSEGLLFFILLPTLTCFTVTAAGLFFIVWLQRRWLAYLTYLGFLLITCIPVAYNLIYHPPVFAFHPIFGYFPGPIYDFIISITSTLLIARGQTVLWGLLFLFFTIFACDISRTTGLIPKLRWRKLTQFTSINSNLWIITIFILITTVIGLELFSGKLGIRPSRKDIAQALGGYRETSHFEIYYALELENEIELFAADCEFRYKQLSEFLQTDSSRKVRAYLYASPSQKKRLIGAGNTYVEDPFGYGFHLHTQGFPHPVLKHELAHVLTADWSPWNVSLNVGVHEGIAVAADWNEGKLTVHQWAKAMRELNVAPPLSSVMGLGFWAHAGSRSYLLAGSFIRYLVDTYGLDKIKTAFPIGSLSKSFDKELYTLENEWMKFLNGQVFLNESDINYAARRLKRGGIFEQVCAHEMAALRDKAWTAYYRNDLTTATNIFYQMLSDEPDNQRTVLGLMYSANKSGDKNQAASLAKSIFSDKNSLYRSQAGQLLGDIYWLEGEIDKAVNTYNESKILATHETIELNIIKRIEALSESHSELNKDRLRSVLVGDSTSVRIGNGAKMSKLLQIIGAEPNAWLAYFLVGELLHNEKAWKLSTQYLQHVLALNSIKRGEKIPSQIKLKTQWWLGVNAFHMKDFNIAKEVFSEIVSDSTYSKGTILSAKYWMDRCEWMTTYLH